VNQQRLRRVAIRVGQDEAGVLVVQSNPNSKQSVANAEGLEFESRVKIHLESDLSLGDSPTNGMPAPSVTHPLRATSEGPASAIHEKARSQERASRKRLMGLEPTTFCMATVCEFRINAG
jgi:hypothetical protein